MKRVLVDKNIHKSSTEFLSGLGFEIIQTGSIAAINNSTSTHPDMQFLKLDKSKAVVCDELFDYYTDKLNDFKLLSFNKVGDRYPFDCLLNTVLLKNNSIMTNLQSEYLSDYGILNQIIVKQGYVKCNVCVLNQNAVITSDSGIAKALNNYGYRVYLLPCDQIKLDGYKNGFWGGCSGLLDERTLYFNGDITKLDCFFELKSILQKEKIEPFYNSEIELTDNGSIIVID